MASVKGSSDTKKQLEALVRRANHAVFNGVPEVADKSVAAIFKIMNSDLIHDWKIVFRYFTDPTKKENLNECVTSLQCIVNCVSKWEDRTFWLVISYLCLGLQWWEKAEGFTTPLAVTSIYQNIFLPLNKVIFDDRTPTLMSSEMFSSLLQNFCQVGAVLAYMCRVSYKLKQESCLDLVSINLEVFARGKLGLLKMIEAKAQTTIVTNLWSHYVAHTTNSIEDFQTILISSDVYRVFVEFCRCVIPSIATIKIAHCLDERRVDLLYRRWESGCQKLEQFDDLLFIRALRVVTSTGRSAAMSLWVQAKLTATAQFKNMTFSEFWETMQTTLKKWDVDPKLLDVDNKTLLLCEFEAYQSTDSPEFSTAIANTWTTLKTSGMNLEQKCRAVHALIVSSMSRPTLSQHTKCGLEAATKLLHLLRVEMQKDGERRARYCLLEGNLKFALYLHALHDLQSQAEPESLSLMMKNIRLEAEEKAKYGESLDATMCDIAPNTISSLSLETEATLLAKLSDVVLSWQGILSFWKTNCLTDEECRMLISQLVRVGDLATLYGDSTISVRVWVLTYKLAQHTEKLSSQLFAISMLLRECDVEPSDSELITSGDVIVETLLKNGGESEVVLTYWFSLVQTNLRVGKVREAVQLLEKCKPMIDKSKDNETYYIMKAKYYLYSSKVLCGDPSFGNVLDSDIPQYFVYKASGYCKAGLEKVVNASMVANGMLSVTVLVQALETSLWAAEVFSALYLTSYVRVLVDNVYMMCQRLNLASRTAQLLCILLQVDITNRNVSDAQLKFGHLQNLLRRPATQIINKTNEKTLQVPVPARSRAISPVRSCVLTNDRSPLSAFLETKMSSTEDRQHPPSCACYFCRSLLLQFTGLNARGCEALLHSLNDSKKLAESTHKKCMNELENFELEKFSLDIKNELAVAFKNEVVLFKSPDLYLLTARLKMNYASFTMLAGNLETSAALLDKAEMAFNRLSFQRMLIVWRLAELRLCGVALKRERRKTELEAVASTLIREKDDVPLEVNTLPHKTPRVVRQIFGNNQPPNIAKRKNSPKSPGLPLKRPVRRILCDKEMGSGSENDNHQDLVPSNTVDGSSNMAVTTPLVARKLPVSAAKSIISTQKAQGASARIEIYKDDSSDSPLSQPLSAVKPKKDEDGLVKSTKARRLVQTSSRKPRRPRVIYSEDSMEASDSSISTGLGERLGSVRVSAKARLFFPPDTNSSPNSIAHTVSTAKKHKTAFHGRGRKLFEEEMSQSPPLQEMVDPITEQGTKSKRDDPCSTALTSNDVKQMPKVPISMQKESNIFTDSVGDCTSPILSVNKVENKRTYTNGGSNKSEESNSVPNNTKTGSVYARKTRRPRVIASDDSAEIVTPLEKKAEASGFHTPQPARIQSAKTLRPATAVKKITRGKTTPCEANVERKDCKESTRPRVIASEDSEEMVVPPQKEKVEIDRLKFRTPQPTKIQVKSFRTANTTKKIVSESPEGSVQTSPSSFTTKGAKTGGEDLNVRSTRTGHGTDSCVEAPPFSLTKEKKITNKKSEESTAKGKKSSVVDSAKKTRRPRVIASDDSEDNGTPPVRKDAKVDVFSYRTPQPTRNPSAANRATATVKKLINSNVNKQAKVDESASRIEDSAKAMTDLNEGCKDARRDVSRDLFASFESDVSLIDRTQDSVHSCDDEPTEKVLSLKGTASSVKRTALGLKTRAAEGKSLNLRGNRL